MPNISIESNKLKGDILVFKKSPILVYTGHVSDEFSLHLPLHQHTTYCEMLFIRKGNGKIIINDNSYNVSKNDIIILNQGVLHEETYESDQGIEYFYCAIANLAIEGLQEGILIPTTISPVIHCTDYVSKIEYYISELFQEGTEQEPGFITMNENLLKSLLILVIRILNKSQRIFAAYKSSSAGNKIKEYIENNYNKNISLKEIAESLFLSQHYLCHAFKREIGISPIQYLIHRRVEEAKKLLLNTNKSFQEVSSIVGYENAVHFNILFKKATGLSPGKYKEGIKNGMNYS
jgi:YesN/AraC family two-component response regulator